MATLVDCPACNSKVSMSASACPRCGHPIREELSHGAVLRRADGSGGAAASDTMSLMGMICGIVGIGVAFVPFEWSWIAVILSILAIIFSCVSLNRIGRGSASGKGMAVSGLITGGVGLVIFVLALVFVITSEQPL